ncbi:MAG: hypothetical protein HYT80_11680 [Euryarchaeota archaeon]|nr:hypothetical protein [Euryarchaeota archaeon]
MKDWIVVLGLFVIVSGGMDGTPVEPPSSSTEGPGMSDQAALIRFSSSGAWVGRTDRALRGPA